MFQIEFKKGTDIFAADFDGGGAVFHAEFEETVVIDRGAYNFGSGLVYDKNRNRVSVDTADKVASGDKRPVTSDAVYVEVGNIETLLKTL